MKALVLKETGNMPQLDIEEVETPKANNANDVVIKLKASALNRRDIMIFRGQIPDINLPIILGSDGAGEVVEIGNGVNNFSIGDEVIINPGLDWGNNPEVKNEDFTVLGVPKDGTFAQYIRISEENVYAKPSHLSWEEAATIPLAGLTAYRAMITKGNPKPGENVLVPGAGGGVATYIVQFASAAGANVYVTSSKENKIQSAIDLGAKNGVNYTEENWEDQIQELTGGIDLTVDSIAGDNFKSLISVGKIASRIVTFGATRGPISDFMLPSMSLKEMTIIGSTMGSPEDFSDMLQFIEEHKIQPVIDTTYSLEEAPSAFEKLEKGDNFGKIVLTIPQD